MYLCVRDIAVIVTTHESGRHVFCVFEVSLLPLSRFFYCILEYSVVFLVFLSAHSEIQISLQRI